MPPKGKPVVAPTTVYIVLSGNEIDSVHASLSSTNTRIANGGLLRYETREIVGGSVNVEPELEAAPAPKKKAAKAKADIGDAPAKKTTPPEVQRAANAKNPLPKNGPVDASSLPENVQALLRGSGATFAGLTICVTGVPPILGRKNAEKLVENYGGKLAKSLSKNTDYVVVGEQAGPKKLEQIEDLGLETVDEDGLIEMLEGGGVKRVAADDEKPKSKKQKA